MDALISEVNIYMIISSINDFLYFTVTFYSNKNKQTTSTVQRLQSLLSQSTNNSFDTQVVDYHFFSPDLNNNKLGVTLQN